MLALCLRVCCCLTACVCDKGAINIKVAHNVVLEFAQSEKAYVESLKVLVESFFPGIASFGEQIDREPHMHGAYTAMETTVQKLYTTHIVIRDMLHEVAYLKTGTDASLADIVDRLCETIMCDYDVYLAHLTKVLARIGHTGR